MNRTSPQIKRDMLEWVKKHLHIRTSDEWGYDTLEADPLVHLLIGACASEAQLVHETILESDERLQQRLLHYLLPEAYQYPQLAFGIAKALPTASTCQITNTQAFAVHLDKDSFSFMPAFDTTLINGKVRFVGTDTNIIDTDASVPYLMDSETKRVTKLLIGIETKQKVNALENVAFYFDWKGSVAEKQAFLLALSNSRWVWGEQNLNHRVGLATDAILWSDQFSAEKELLRRINAQYRLNFHVLADNPDATPVEMPVSDVLQAWLRNQGAVTGEESNTTEKWAGLKGNFIWLRIDLPYAVQLTDPERNMVVALNHFPVINRRLVQKTDEDTYFSRSMGLEVFSIQPPKGIFCGIQAIKNRENGTDIPPMNFSQLLRLKSDQPAYSIRYGGCGRSDTYNAWERMSYMLSIFRQEQRDREIVEKLGARLSLEELHEAIGQRLSKDGYEAAEQSPSEAVYVFVNPGAQRQLDTEVCYWTSEGESANDIQPDTSLIGNPPIAGLDPAKTKLVTATKGGKNGLSPTEQTQALQDALVRRGRVVTANDVKSLCGRVLGEHLQEVHIKPFFETDMTPQGGVRRAMEVSLKVTRPEDQYIQQLGQEIEWNLQENSVGTIPYRVRIC